MFFVVRSDDIFNFPLGLIKYIAIVKSGNEQGGGGGGGNALLPVTV